MHQVWIAKAMLQQERYEWNFAIEPSIFRSLYESFGMFLRKTFS